MSSKSNKEKTKENLKEELERKTKENEELVEQLKRLQAEFDNYRKRVEKQKDELKDFILKDFIIKLLPILDSFEVALKHDKNNEEFRKGVELIYAQLHSYLKSLGLREIKAKGKFNPELHEVLLAEKSDKPENQIIEELQKGYTLNGKVIRTAKVKISKGD